MGAAAATPLPAFVVDKKGLAKLLERKGKSFAVIELIQNAWDEDTGQVDVVLERAGVFFEPDTWKLVVEDDNPEGFKNLAHAYTLFAESAKKDDATKRGRFNLGEKLVIALCEVAEVATTKGTVTFTGDSRMMTKTKRKAGSVFTGYLKLSDGDVAEIKRVVSTLLPPHGIVTTFNLQDIEPREPLRAFEVSLRTELADADGRLKPTTRKTTVEVYKPAKGETPGIYEMGIPVVDTGDRFHINVMQKVPLPTDRDNVPPAYLRDLRVAVLNHCYDLLSPEDAKASWVSNAMEDPKASPEAIKAAFAGKFGEKAVIFDPNDPEANKLAASQGYTVVPGGSLPKAAWAQVKGAGAAQPAGKVTPSPNPDGNGPTLKTMDPAYWPGYVQNVVSFAKDLSLHLFQQVPEVVVANDPKWGFAAAYGPGKLTLNIGRLGHAWFEQIGWEQIDLLIHEFGHHNASDHLSSGYYHELTKIGAKLVMLALTEPDLFERHGVPVVAISS